MRPISDYRTPRQPSQPFNSNQKMLKPLNQSCLALQPPKTHLISGFLRRPGFIAAQFAAHSTAASPERYRPIASTRELEEKFGIPWKSTCLPLSPEIRQKIDLNGSLRRELKDLWKSRNPEYPDDVNKLVSSSESPQPGESLAVSFSSLFGTGGYLVRNNSDRVDLNADTFKGKFVLVCCFHAPPPPNCQRIINVCDELYSTRDDVEVVMAAWMNSLVDADDHKQVFDHFFSAFPKSCLSVPFEDFKRRAHVCKLVADYTSWELKYFPCLVLDTQGMALPPFEHYSYGAVAFPFTEEILKDIKARDLQLKKAGSLEQLLLINSSSPDVVYKFKPEGGPREEVHISELNNKLVGLYVPSRSGGLFPTLLHIYEQCMKKQLEFEIVVAYSEHSSNLHDRKFYQEKIDRLLLQKHDICRQWWCLPLNNSVSARLDRVIQSYGRNFSDSDKLCVVGPAGGFIDVYAPGVVMEKYGVDGYPFTRETMIQKEVSDIREITLESVFLGDDLFRGNDRDDITSAKKLSGKKISVYFGCLYYMWDYENVLSSYHEMKAKDPEFEVVFVYLKDNMDGVELYDKTIYAMPWYICSFDLDRLESMREKLRINTGSRIYGNSSHAIVGFGEDGRVCSVRRAQIATFTFDDTLYEDVSKRRSDLPCDRDDLEY